MKSKVTESLKGSVPSVSLVSKCARAAENEFCVIICYSKTYD